ncbi:hypothetical protein DFJ73DRAFT_70638 [Zopfochytrium polystomum]|nr:hypothetical protein DFJ73DRAFT_70638 [Zopfochytrium polystomum]
MIVVVVFDATERDCGGVCVCVCVLVVFGFFFESSFSFLFFVLCFVCVLCVCVRSTAPKIKFVAVIFATDPSPPDLFMCALSYIYMVDGRQTDRLSCMPPSHHRPLTRATPKLDLPVRTLHKSLDAVGRA